MALFMLGGRVLSMKRTSRHFDDNVAWMASDLIGVYDCGADNRCVKDDLLEFYSIKRA